MERAYGKRAGSIPSLVKSNNLKLVFAAFLAQCSTFNKGQCKASIESWPKIATDSRDQ